MRFMNTLTIMISLMLVMAACSPEADSGGSNGNNDTNNATDLNNGTNDGTGTYVPDCVDDDGDHICNDDEGKDVNRDTDGDGTPDYLDDDSDNDGIPDSAEAQYDPATDELIDTDGDGTPDPFDTDSDGDGISDRIESSDDVDGDGIPNYRDTDADGDGIADASEVGDASEPVDYDNDGMFDFLDNDSDNDGIGDRYEGMDDPDNDTIPSYHDDDSDGDTIPDSVEAGTGGDPTAAPADTDWDGTPDFLDNDSDNNGIPDGIDGDADIDGDGYPNSQDIDDDGDYLPDEMEIGDDPSNPRDTDGDGVPDYRDDDSDNDGIADAQEGIDDPDGDGIPNYLDTDSDGDGIPDSIEGGNQTLNDPPRDTDGDGIADYMDVDSDNDGLRDGLEDANHNGVVDPGESSPFTDDTDGDGVSDLIEHAAGTDPTDPNDNPQDNGDFVFLEPYQQSPTPTEDVLDFSTSFKALDLFFVEDISGSMSTEINSVRNNLGNMLGDVVCDPGEDPNVTGCVPSVESGVEVFGGRYGSQNCDGTYCLIKAIDNNNMPSDPGPDSSCTYNKLPTNVGGGSEFGVGAVWDTLQGNCSSNSSRIGKGCYRPDALKIALLVTDETLDQGNYYSTTYFNPIYNGGVKVILMYTGADSTLQNQGVNMTTSSGDHLVPLLNSSATSGIPECSGLGSNVFYQNRAILDGDGSTAGQAMTCAVKAVSSYMPQDVESWIFNDPGNVDYFGNSVDAPSTFIDFIEVFMPGTAQCPSGYSTIDSDGDGHADTFDDILPGSAVCWKIHVKQNNTVQPAPDPQMFRATVEVHGAGGALLDTRDVYFLVPPANNDNQ